MGTGMVHLPTMTAGIGEWAMNEAYALRVTNVEDYVDCDSKDPTSHTGYFQGKAVFIRITNLANTPLQIARADFLLIDSNELVRIPRNSRHPMQLSEVKLGPLQEISGYVIYDFRLPTEPVILSYSRGNSGERPLKIDLTPK